MFTQKELKIVPRGLNLITPGDQAGEGDCLQLDGFGPGSIGRLVQARGFVLKNSGDVGVTVDSLAECNGATFYAGGGKLYKIGADTAGAYIDSGYDGSPVDMCAYQGQLWVMNRSKQRRVDPSTGVASDWKVADPPIAPTVVVSAGGGLEDGEHSYYVSYVDSLGYETSPSPVAAVSVPPASVSDGTVSLTFGSTAVTLSGATWGPEIDGMQFLIPSEYPTVTPPMTAPYTISYASPTTGTLSVGWAGLSASGLSFIAYPQADTAKATITRPTAASITSWNVYRRSPTMDAPYLVNLTPIAYATATYVDYGDAAHEQDTGAVIANGVAMEANHGAPPAARVLADRPYNGRLVAANSAAHPNRIWYTNPLQPSFFPGSANPQSGNWVDVGDDTGDAILWISVKPGLLLIYRQRSIWRHIGDLGDGFLEPLVPNMGVVGQRAVAPTSRGDLALTRQGKSYGVYRITDWDQPISAAIDTVLSGMGAELYTALNGAASSVCALGHHMGRLWLSYPSGSATANDRTLLCDLESGSWYSRATGFGAFLRGSSFFLAGRAGKVVSLEDGTGTEDGTAVSLNYRSRYEDCGTPEQEKSFADLVLHHNTAGATVHVYAVLNKGTESVALADITSSGLTRQVIPMVYPVGHISAGLPIEAFSLAISFVGSGAAAYPGVVIDGPLLLHYFLKPRKGLTFDSGPIDLGQTGAKEIDAVEVDMDGAALHLFIQTDLPGGTMAERTSGGTGIAVTASSGRQVRRYTFTKIQGRILRIKGAADDATRPFLIYRIRARVLPYGVYVDGTFGDTYYTGPIAAGVE